MSSYDNYDEFEEDDNAAFFHTTSAPATYEEEAEQTVYGRHARHSVEDDIRDAIDMINRAKQLPMSSSVKIPRDELVLILEDALNHLPPELLEARRALRAREELMAEEIRKAENMLEVAAARAAQLVEQTEIVRQARTEAQAIVAEAKARARQMVNETEDFLDKKLAEYEINVGSILSLVQRARTRLAQTELPMHLNVDVENDFFGDTAAAPSAPRVFDAEAEGDDGFSSGF